MKKYYEIFNQWYLSRQKKKLENKKFITSELCLELQNKKSVTEIVLFINNNALTLIEEIPCHCMFLDKLKEDYIAYNLSRENQDWEYTLLPKNYEFVDEFSLITFYKNIIIRLHHYTNMEIGEELPWYNTYTTISETENFYNAIKIKKKNEDLYTIKVYKFIFKHTTSLVLHQEEFLQNTYYILGVFHGKKNPPVAREMSMARNPLSNAILHPYQQKNQQDIEKYKNNYQKNFNKKILKEYIEKNPKKAYRFLCIYPKNFI